jgi:carbamoyltransferase
MPLTLGLGGVRRHACAAVADRHDVLSVCEQERITRVRGAGYNGTGLPDEAVDAALASVGAARSDVTMCAVAEEVAAELPWPTERFNHHHAHACAAYLTSPFQSAAILVCDHEPPGVSVWVGNGPDVQRIDWPWTGPSISALYTQCARLFGFTATGGDQMFEALARLMMSDPDDRLPVIFSTDGAAIEEQPDWRSIVKELLASPRVTAKARVAAAVQRQIERLAVEVLARIQTATERSVVCLGGSLFYHSSINTAVRQSGLFERVFVPANPGNAGLSVGAAMRASQLAPRRVSAFLGPSYDPDAIKATLDNCKLRYDWVEEGAAIRTAVKHLTQGRLVGWFEGRMEWGPRALGARSILASPFHPHVLENLNRFLKRREEWRGYAVSVLDEALSTHFSGPAEAPFMECDYRPKDAGAFRWALPSPCAAIRVQTVGADSPPRYRELVRAFGEVTGVPCVMNTSFNGFHEPIVCTPRDAVRVFYGSGLDVLLLDRFELTK